MKIKALHSQIVDVEIDQTDFLKSLYDKWLLGKPGEYINSNNEWESWDDCRGQGSGLKEQHGKASEEEVEVNNAFIVLLNQEEI